MRPLGNREKTLPIIVAGAGGRQAGIGAGGALGLEAGFPKADPAVLVAVANSEIGRQSRYRLVEFAERSRALHVDQADPIVDLMPALGIALRVGDVMRFVPG